MPDIRTDTSTAAPEERAPQFSLRAKFIFTLIVLSFLPFLFIYLYLFSGYSSLLNEALAAIPDTAAHDDIQLRADSVRNGAYTLGFVILVLIGAGIHLAESMLTGQVRTLLAWLKDMRAQKFAKVVASPVAATDEIGELGTVMTESITYFQDIEKREKQISDQKVEFISVAAHQLRTPLTGLRWGVESLSSAKTVAEERKKVSVGMSATIVRMVSLVDDLLDAAKIEEGKFGFDFQTTDLIPTLQKLTKPLDLIAQSRNLSLTFEHDESAVVFVDPSRIELAVSNLLANALDYTPAGGTVKLRLADAGKRVEISISDTGIGIPHASMPQLFNKFSRGENAVRMRPDGTGLGLFIVKNIVERHGGTVRVETELDKGTTFSFTVPKDAEGLAAVPRVSVERLFESV